MSPAYRRDSGEAPARPRCGVAGPGFELSLLSAAYPVLLSPTHSCLHRQDLVLHGCSSSPSPISGQVQELIINKDPTLLDNFLDVSD